MPIESIVISIVFALVGLAVTRVGLFSRPVYDLLAGCMIVAGGLCIAVYPIKNIDAFYVTKSGSIIQLKHDITSLADCQQYASNYIKGLSGTVRCVDSASGDILWDTGAHEK